MYSSCVRSCLLHGSENWPVRRENELDIHNAKTCCGFTEKSAYILLKNQLLQSMYFGRNWLRFCCCWILWHCYSVWLVIFCFWLWCSPVGIFTLTIFRFFGPAGATRCTDQSEIWQGGADHRFALLCQISLHLLYYFTSGVWVYGP